MASISVIVSLESTNLDRIYLHREGLFWKACQRSAYLFVQHYNSYKVTKRFVKAVKQEVVSLGFPDAVLHKLFAADKLVRVDEKQLYICCDAMNEEAYKEWFAGVSIAVEEPRQPLPVAQQVQPQQASVKPNRIDYSDEAGRMLDVVSQIRAFQLESSTPMDCMNFVVSLRQLLN